MECNGHGVEEDEGCDCDLGWFQNDCSVSGEEKWDNSWYVLEVIFGIAYFYLSVHSLYKLHSAMRVERAITWKRMFKRLYTSPKNMSLFCLCLLGLMRGFWVSIDPLNFKGISNRALDRILFESVYALLFTIYCSVLLVWAGLYQGIRSVRSDPFKIVRKVTMVLMVLAYPIAIFVSICRGFRVPSEVYVYIGYIGILFAVVFLTTFFILFGFLLLKYVHVDSSFGLASQEFASNVQMTSVLYTTRNKHTEQSAQDSLSRQVSYKNDLDISLRSYNANSSFEPSEESYCENISSQGAQISEEPVTIRENRDKKYLLVLSKEDKVVITKLIVMTSASAFIGFLTIVFGVVLAVQGGDLFEKPDWVLAILYLSLSLEYLGCLLILYVFTAEIKVPEKENIKHLAYMARKNKNFTPVVKCKLRFQHIGRRLKNYWD